MIQYENNFVTVFQSQLYKTTSTVIQTSHCVLIVDPNLLPNEIEEIRQFVEHVKGERPIYLFFTHSDWDHLVGYGAFPEATVIAGVEFTNRLDKEEIIEQIKAFDEQYYIDRPYPLTYPTVDIIVKEDGQQLKLGETILTFYKAPGHTNDGFFLIIEPVGVWVAGDYFSDLEFPFIYDHSEHYEETIQKVDSILEKHSIQLLIPGHGHVTTSIDEMKKRKENALQYIDALRATILQNQENFHLIKDYPYLSELRKSHEENSQLVKKELGKTEDTLDE